MYARFGGNHGEFDCYDADTFDKNANKETCVPAILPVAYRSSIAPATTDSTCAVFTFVHNENVMLPIWLRYYVKNVGAEHLWVLDHNTDDDITDPEKLPAGVHYRKLYGDPA